MRVIGQWDSKEKEKSVNRIQMKIFEKLAAEKDMDIEEFLSNHSPEYIGRKVTDLADLREEEADSWITKAYLESLG